MQRSSKQRFAPKISETSFQATNIQSQRTYIKVNSLVKLAFTQQSQCLLNIVGHMKKGCPVLDSKWLLMASKITFTAESLMEEYLGVSMMSTYCFHSCL